MFPEIKSSRPHWRTNDKSKLQNPPKFESRVYHTGSKNTTGFEGNQTSSKEMWRKALVSYAGGVLLKQPWWRTIAARLSSSSKATSSSVAVNSILLRSLKDHYLEVSKMTPPPVITSTLLLSLSIFLNLIESRFLDCLTC